MIKEINLHNNYELRGETNKLIEWEYISIKKYENPFEEIELDIHIEYLDNKWTVPSFWKGGNTWVVRFIPEKEGIYNIISKCSDINNKDLHSIKHSLKVKKGNNIQMHKLTISNDKVYITNNNKPFFWLSDTWWMALSDRLKFPDFKKLVNKRKKQGFNVIQIVAGLFPDMDSFDERCSNQGGLPWKHGYKEINPEYFNYADEKINYLYQQGFVICIVGSWGYHIDKMGIDKIKKHWRYIIARWSVYPIVWCIAGEASMPYYSIKNRIKRILNSRKLKTKWTEVAKYIKHIEPFDRLLTIHPKKESIQELKDSSMIDINMFHASHNGYSSIKKIQQLLSNAKKRIPLLADEINYENIFRDTNENIQRLSFWTSILYGSKGYGYGANGIWQINTENSPFGISVSGANWGNTPWKNALKFNGAKQIAKSKKFLEQFPWYLLENMQHTIKPKKYINNTRLPKVAGINKTFRIVYIYDPIYPWSKHYILCHLRPRSAYKAFFWNPQLYTTHTVGIVYTTTNGQYKIPTPPTLEDWIFILKLI